MGGRRGGDPGRRGRRPVGSASAAFDELARALPAPIVSLSLRDWPADFPDDVAVQMRSPWEARADAVMYRQVLADVACALLAGVSA